jgi:hypothetical protein
MNIMIPRDDDNDNNNKQQEDVEGAVWQYMCRNK